MHEADHCTSIINLTYQDGSEGSPSNPAKFNKQDYAQLKDTCLRRRKLFVDRTFPPNNRSLGDLPDLSSWRENQVEWLRPADILKAQNIKDEPVFCMNGASRFDFGQGIVGNCWFLAAVSSLTFHKGLMVQVVPMNQSFKNYAGIFHFKFWRFGKWVDVVIDDYLPTLDKHLMFVHAKDANEFWVPLLEKAYAKVCGSYSDMNAGLPSEACKDFSGGVHMSYKLREAHTVGHEEELWLSLKRATGCNSMICCGTSRKGDKLVNSVEYNGLVDAHAYSITGVTEVNCDGTTVRLVRIINPWGRQEWNGRWSDKSEMWNRVSAEDREKCFDWDNGEFWMELEDFCYYFEMMSICCENPNFMDGDLSCQWKCRIYEGSWVAGISAGGNISDSTFATNPQYRIHVTKIDEEGDKNMLFSLMQKPQRHNRSEARFYPIGLTIIKVPPGTPQGRLGSAFFRRNMYMYTVKDQQKYIYGRELIEHHSLEPGEYVVIPSTMNPYMSADFVLTVYSKAETKIRPHDGGDYDEEENLILPEIPTEEEEVPMVEEEEEQPTEKDPIRAMFDRYAYQNELSTRQLQKLLRENFHGTQHGFYLDTCRSMISIVDTDQRMTMTFSEFSTLWEKMTELNALFHRCDSNHTGSLSEYELKRAIQAAGIETSDTTVKLMMFRYSDFSTISLEAFITIMIRLDKMSNVFKDKSLDHEMHMNFEDWAITFMYN